MRGDRFCVRWTTREDQILREHYPHGGYRICLSLLRGRRTQIAIVNRASWMGIRAGIDTTRLCPYCNERPLRKLTCGDRSCQRKRTNILKKADELHESVCHNHACCKVFSTKYRNLYCSEECKREARLFRDALYRQKLHERVLLRRQARDRPKRSPYPCLFPSSGGPKVKVRRDFDCKRYLRCLDFADEQNWRGFRCKVKVKTK